MITGTTHCVEEFSTTPCHIRSTHFTKTSATQSAGAGHLSYLPLSTQKHESLLMWKAPWSLPYSCLACPGCHTGMSSTAHPHPCISSSVPSSPRISPCTLWLVKLWNLGKVWEQRRRHTEWWLTKSQRTLSFCFQYEFIHFSSNTDTVMKSTEVEILSWAIVSILVEASSEESTVHLMVVVCLSNINLFTLLTFFLINFRRESINQHTMPMHGTVNVVSTHLFSLLWKSRRKGALPPGLRSPVSLQLPHILRFPSSISLFSVVHSFASQY